MLVKLLLFITTAAGAGAEGLNHSRNLPGAEAYCASLLTSATAADPAARAALDYVIGRLAGLRQEVASTPDWTRDVRRAYRQIWHFGGPARVKFPNGTARARPGRRAERMVDCAFDRFRAAAQDIHTLDPKAYPLLRVEVGAPAIRAYFESVRANADGIEATVAREAAPAPRPRFYPAQFLGTATVTSVFGGIALLGAKITMAAAMHNHPKAAMAVPVVLVLFIVTKLPPRVRRLGLSLREGFEALIGRANEPRVIPSARAETQFANQVLALAEDPATPADVLMTASWNTRLPLRHIETDKVIGDPAHRRPAPTPRDITAALIARGHARLPVDAREVAHDVAFFRNERGEPTVLILGRERRYAHDHH